MRTGADRYEDRRGGSSLTGVVVATVTHDNLEGLRLLVASLVQQRAEVEAEVLVVGNAPGPDTRQWLDAQRGAVTVVYTSTNVGPGAGRNVVLHERPSADVYIFVDDDVLLAGHELRALRELLETSERIGIGTGFPLTDAGAPLAAGFQWRPLSGGFAKLWDRWWGRTIPPEIDSLVDADRISSSLIAVRGSAARASGGFDPVFWPGCHEDTDFCARLRFTGYRIVVDRRIEFRQKLSVTTRKVLGTRHLSLCRSTGVIYATMDYPAILALGRLMEAAIRSILGPRALRRADAEGLLRCAENWRHIARRRRQNRRARALRDGR